MKTASEKPQPQEGVSREERAGFSLSTRDRLKGTSMRRNTLTGLAFGSGLPEMNRLQFCLAQGQCPCLVCTRPWVPSAAHSRIPDEKKGKKRAPVPALRLSSRKLPQVHFPTSKSLPHHLMQNCNPLYPLVCWLVSGYSDTS